LAFLVDTNVLLRLVASADPLHETATASIQTLEEGNEEFDASGQNFIELWNVATRPADKNGLGLTPEAADRMLRKLEPAFPRLDEPADVYGMWRNLVVRFGVSGVQVHDARLVAVMLTNDVSDILTFNAQDFQRYAELGIRALDPRDA
jgi:predicted nucleic acid-binding protein